MKLAKCKSRAALVLNILFIISVPKIIVLTLMILLLWCYNFSQPRTILKYHNCQPVYPMYSWCFTNSPVQVDIAEMKASFCKSSFHSYLSYKMFYFFIPSNFLTYTHTVNWFFTYIVSVYLVSIFYFLLLILAYNTLNNPLFYCTHTSPGLLTSLGVPFLCSVRCKSQICTLFW